MQGFASSISIDVGADYSIGICRRLSKDVRKCLSAVIERFDKTAASPAASRRLMSASREGIDL